MNYRKKHRATENGHLLKEMTETFRTSLAKTMNWCHLPVKVEIPKYIYNKFYNEPKIREIALNCRQQPPPPENSHHLKKMTEQSSRCLLPTGSVESDQKSENVKSCGMLRWSNDLIFVIFCRIKTQLHQPQVIPL